MGKKFFLGCTFLLFCLQSSLVFAAKADKNQADVTVINFFRNNVSFSVGYRNSSNFFDVLNSCDEYYVADYVATDEFVKKTCKNNRNISAKDLALKSGQNFSSQFCVYGQITGIDTVVETKKISKYLVKKITKRSYKIVVKVVDLKTGEIQKVYRETAEDDAALSLKTKRIATRIKFYFLDNIEQPKKKRRHRKRRVTFQQTVIALYPSFFYPFGNLGKMADFGYGGALHIERYVTKNGKARFSFPLEYYEMKPKMRNISSMRMGTFVTNFGFTFGRRKIVGFTPFMGAGVGVYQVVGDNSGENLRDVYNMKKTYFTDGIFNLGAEFTLNCSKWFSIGILTKYVVFIEKAAVGQAITAEVGVKFLF